MEKQEVDNGRFEAFSEAEIAVIREALTAHEPKEIGRNRSIAGALLVEIGPSADVLEAA